jgi:hypothetical protein
MNKKRVKSLVEESILKKKSIAELQNLVISNNLGFKKLMNDASILLGRVEYFLEKIEDGKMGRMAFSHFSTLVSGDMSAFISVFSSSIDNKSRLSIIIPNERM